jgi:hypothetical protein
MISEGHAMTTKDEEARKLAEVHYEVEPGMIRIFRLIGDVDAEARAEEPIKLLEVNENTVPVGIMPLGFGPSPSHGIHHLSVIVEVTPDEYDKIRANELTLPDGWKVGELFPKPAVPAEA